MSVEDRQLGDDPFQHEAGVPRQFGVGTLFVFSTMYAVLFGIWRLIGGSPQALVWVALFVSAVGLGQMLLFQGRRPRRASVIVGACVLPCVMLSAIVYEGRDAASPADLIGGVFFGLVCGIVAGPVLGYVAGLLIAGHFLVIDMLKNLGVRSNDIDRADWSEDATGRAENACDTGSQQERGKRNADG